MAFFVYLFTVIGSFALGIFTTIFLGFMGSGDIGIVNSALISASISFGVVAGRCLMSLSNHQFSFKAILVSLVCFALPALALLTHCTLTSFPGSILAAILKYVFLAVSVVVGFIPGLMINAAFSALKASEDLAAGVVIAILFVVPTVEGALLGGSIVDAVNPLSRWLPDAVVEDEDGSEHRIFFT
ncbi:MAG: hypothetical protein LIP12_02875 [Clostridiales bacterium]|nr:hypothetical protein [Clostridiales bacterium]